MVGFDVVVVVEDDAGDEGSRPIVVPLGPRVLEGVDASKVVGGADSASAALGGDVE